jgi:hypothetical protein
MMMIQIHKEPEPVDLFSDADDDKATNTPWRFGHFRNFVDYTGRENQTLLYTRTFNNDANSHRYRFLSANHPHTLPHTRSPTTKNSTAIGTFDNK